MTIFSQGEATVNAIADSKRYANAAEHASATNAESCAESFGERCARTVMQLVHGLLERKNVKPATDLHLRSGRSLRSVQTWFQGRHEAPAGALIDLLLSEEGPAILQKIRAEAEAAGRPVPEWFDDLAAVAAVNEAMRRQRSNSRQRAMLREKPKA